MHDLERVFDHLRHSVHSEVATPDLATIVTGAQRRRTARIKAAVALTAVFAIAVGLGAAVRETRSYAPMPADTVPPASVGVSTAPAPSTTPSATTPAPTAGATAPTVGPTRPAGSRAPIDPAVIPSGFLAYEAEAAANPATVEYRRDSPAGWPPQQCPSQPAPGVVPTAERFLTFKDPTRPVWTEVVTLFADTGRARDAFGQLRAEVARCPGTYAAGATTTRTVTTLAMGEEAILVTAVTTGSVERTLWTVYVRRGLAIAGYTGAAEPQVRTDAAAMTAKFCRYDPACGQAAGP